MTATDFSSEWLEVVCRVLGRKLVADSVVFAGNTVTIVAVTPDGKSKFKYVVNVEECN